MKFCKNCGNELIAGKQFCTNCGHKQGNGHIVEKLPNVSPATTYKPEETQMPQPKAPMSKKAKITWLALAIVALSCLGIHKFLENQFSPHTVLAEVEETIENGDIKKARTTMDFSAIDHKVADKELKSYLHFLQQNGDISKGLTNAFSAISQGSMSESVFTGSGNEVLRVSKEPKKKWGLYEQYKIEAVPYLVKISSNLDRAEVEYNGIKKELQDSLEVPGVLPGEHVVIGQFKGEYSELSQEAGVDFTQAHNNVVDVFLEFPGNYVAVYSNEYDSTLFVNGKSTGEKIGSHYELGPLPVDGSITLHAEYQGENGVIKTAEAKVMNTDNVYLEFKEEDLNPVVVTAEPDDSRTSIEDFMIRYINTSVEAMNEGDFTIVESLLHPDGKSYPESKSYIDYIVSKGIKEDVLSVKMIDFEETENGYLVTMEEEYDIHYSDGSTKNKTFKSTYLVKGKDGQFTVWSLEDTEEL